MEKQCGIYGILNTVNGKWNIGQAVDIAKRWREHRCGLRSGHHFNSHLQRAFNKYGEASFQFLILVLCDRSELDDSETHQLNIRGGAKSDNVYNIRDGGQAGKYGKPRAPGLMAPRGPMPQEVRDKLAAAQRGKKASYETKAKMSAAAKGVKKSKEHAAAIGRGHKGKVVSPETRALQSLAARNRPPATLETRFKISEIMRKRAPRPPLTLEARAHISEAAKRKAPPSPETCARIAAGVEEGGQEPANY